MKGDGEVRMEQEEADSAKQQAANEIFNMTS